MRFKRLLTGATAASVMLSSWLMVVPGCGSGDFLGLEDYQRDLITGGLLAAALLNGAGGGVGAPADGRDGVDGLSCWDLNGNGLADPEEDVNGDGAFNTLDCAGASGTGSGLACWDLNGNGAGDANEDINGDGIFDALDCKGSAGADGQDGTSGSSGSSGPAGANGLELFDIFVDDFFSAGSVSAGLPVGVVSIIEPALGGAARVAGIVPVSDAIAYRAPVAEIYDAGNDVNMRIFFYRIGQPEGECFIFRLDARRLRDGSGAEVYGEPRWVRIDPDVDTDGNTAGDEGPPSGTLLVVDLPINTSAGLGFPNDLESAQFLAFELSTHLPDGALYELVGVEFTEMRPGRATLDGATVFTSGNPEEASGARCGIEDCNGNNISDEHDISNQTSSDCNENGIPDECDISNGTSQDCQPNGVPDECDLADGSAGVVAGAPAGLLFPLDDTYNLVDFFGDGCTGSGCAQGSDQHNDDDSTAVDLPFSFDHYGTLFDSAFVNNNGNLSFGSRFSAFTATGFPVDDFPMVAPFWGDVDTGNPANFIGDVWMRFFDGDSSGGDETLVVTWNNVGYFNERGDKRNTFQVAISDGTNPKMGIGNNICFSYQQMEWTTGEASEGIDGFGGVPATVGMNAGNGTDFFQIGRFDHPGTDYDGPGGDSDGVEYLVGQQICFTASTNTSNINPIASNFPSGNSVTVAGSSGVLDLTLQFLSPETDQTTSVVYDTVVVQGAGIPTSLLIETAVGNVATADVSWAPTCADAGTYDVVFTATDSFEPPGTTEATLRIIVDCSTQDCNGNGIPDECDIRDCPSEDPSCGDCNDNGIPDACDIADVSVVGDVLYGSQGGDACEPLIYTIDPVTGAATPFVDLDDFFPDIDTCGLTGLTFSADGRTLYVSNRYDPVMFLVDMQTVQVDVVDLTLPATADGSTSGGSGDLVLSDLALLPDGRLIGSAPQLQALVVVNPTTGDVSYLCDTVVQGEGPMAAKLAGLAVSPTGILYGSTPRFFDGVPAGTVYTVDLDVDPRNDCVLNPLGSPSGYDKVSGLIFDRDGRLLGTAANDLELIEIDLDTGVGTWIADITPAVSSAGPNYNIDGLAFQVAASSGDCNENGVPDACDIADEFSADVNQNGIPDECEPQ